MFDQTSALWITTGFLSCTISAYAAVHITKVRIKRETFFFIIFVTSFSAILASVLNFVLNVNFPIDWIVTISIVLATPLSCYLAKYSNRTLKQKLKTLGLDQGITILTVFLLASIPVFEIVYVSVPVKVINTGSVFTGAKFEIGNSTAISDSTATGSLFSAIIPLNPRLELVEEEIAKFPNRANALINFSILTPIFDGNLSGIEQFTVRLVSDDGNSVLPINFAEGRLTIKEGQMVLTNHANMSAQLTCLVGSAFPSQTLSVLYQMKMEKNTLSINITIV
jgi:hypothetical protein